MRCILLLKIFFPLVALHGAGAAFRIARCQVANILVFRALNSAGVVLNFATTTVCVAITVAT